MAQARRSTSFCNQCRSTAVFGWQEPPHHLHSALTLALIAGEFVTPATGGLMLLTWIHRLASSRQWGCLHCGA